jgi:hypothetical protein
MNELKKNTGNATCEWVQEGECDLWGTECGEAFTLNEGAPSDNNMRFCCYCGASLIEHPAPDILED